ncbi:MAG: SH3 domain-containing protein [Oscillospiraceae bacterium]|jgi:hypothetical protein|nr:SH3 domain-containing protein [Oscillospiraceae bacterium]
MRVVLTWLNKIRRALTLAAVIIIALTFVGSRAEEARENPLPEPAWRVGVIATESPEELLPLYAEPSASSLTLGGYYAGVNVLFLESESEGLMVPVRVGSPDDPASATGYMERSRLIEWDASDPEADKPVPYSPVLAVQSRSEPGWLNLRERPFHNSRVIEQYPSGALIDVLGVVGEWLHVSAPGASGYMQPQFLSPIGKARVLTSDEFTFGRDSISVTIQLLETGERTDTPSEAATEIVRVLDDRHDVIQTIAVQSAGQLNRDANFILEDMNFDGYPDFRVLADYADNQTHYQYWLFDPYGDPDDPAHPWRFVRAEAYEILKNEPSFDAQVQRIYTNASPKDTDCPAYVDSVYDLDDGVPRLIEALHTLILPDGALRFQLYELQGGSVELMHEWSERMDN